jgi:hyperosmotically inducible protein
MIFVSSPKCWEGRLPTKSSRLVSTLIVLSVMSVSLFAQQISPRTEEYIQREVRHELLMLPYLTVFDNLTYRVDGYTVTLMGQVTDPVVKSDAGNTVKQIEGVEKVVNQIEVLPLSPMDQQLRLRVYRAIYDCPA